MHISLTGISHRTASVSLRERFAFGPEELAPVLAGLSARLGGAAILSTCNRTELYLASDGVVPSDEAMAALAAARGVPAPEGPLFYHETEAAAARHLFRVAAGVDSLVVGESEILGQVREAFSAATAAGRGNAVLARLFHAALRSGRRARSETEIGAHGLSVSALAVSLSRNALGDLRRKTVLVVGAGEAGRRAAAALVQSGVGRLLVTTRRSGRAEEIARELNGATFPFEELAQAVREADVVIASTAAPEAVITTAAVEAAMTARAGRPLVVVDIAVPRDVEASVRDVAGVRLFDIDDLQMMAERNRETREQEIGAVETIIDDEVARFQAWLAGRQVVPTIAALRKRAEATRRAEVARTLAHLPDLAAADRSRIEAMSKALVKRLLHSPVTRLRERGGGRDLDVVRDLFELDERDDA